MGWLLVTRPSTDPESYAIAENTAAQIRATLRFEIGGLRPGEYYALALDRIVPTGLDDVFMLRQLARLGTRVQVDSGRTAPIELKRSNWPE